MRWDWFVWRGAFGCPKPHQGHWFEIFRAGKAAKIRSQWWEHPLQQRISMISISWNNNSMKGSRLGISWREHNIWQSNHNISQQVTLHVPHAKETIVTTVSNYPQFRSTKHPSTIHFVTKTSSHDILVGELSCYTKTELSQIQIHNTCFITNAEKYMSWLSSNWIISHISPNRGKNNQKSLKHQFLLQSPPILNDPCNHRFELNKNPLGGAKHQPNINGETKPQRSQPTPFRMQQTTKKTTKKTTKIDGLNSKTFLLVACSALFLHILSYIFS